MTTLPIEDRTAISTEQQITFCNSPIHLRFSQSGIKNVIVYLWIWNQQLQKTLAEPNYTITKSLVSSSDAYISIQISDLIKGYLVSPLNAQNTDQPVFVYNELDNPSITGQGVFWQIVADVTDIDDITTRYNYNTHFATLGYRWNYEQNLVGNNGIQYGGSLGYAETPNRWYNPRIHNYISQSFDLTKTVEEATTANVITVSDVTPPDAWKRCTRDPYLIVFLNKLGLWDMFTPHGKVVVSTKIDSETGARSFRDPSQIDNTFQHSKLRSNLDVTQSYLINTGSLKEDMVGIVEEIIYSPKVYLIKFKGDLNLTTTLGVTIDSTYITIDDINTTIDGLSVTDEYLAFFKTHFQIPVVLTDSDFQRKTRMNDKNAIDYNMKFEETNNKINNIR